MNRDTWLTTAVEGWSNQAKKEMETQFVKDKMRGQLSLKHLLVWLFCILFQLFFFNFGGDDVVSPFAVPMVFRASVQYTVDAQYLLVYTHFNTWKV